MNRMKLNKLLPALALILLSGLLCCCTDKRESYGTQGGKEKLVSFSVRVPGSGTPKTYALTEDDENEVKNIVILLFDSDGKYTYQPIYNNKITIDGSDSHIKTFTAKIPEGTYDLMILANANIIVGNALSGVGINKGDLKEDVIKKLLLSNRQWNSKPGSAGYVPIPMWGETGTINVNSSLSTTSVSLVRMVAKIDVSLIGATTQAKFKLKSVRLYNYNDKGQIAPDNANWDGTGKIVTAPSLPSTASKPANPGSNPLVYDGTSITTTDLSCLGEIYTFEAEAGTSSTLQNNTCLVVGGLFGTDTQESYYRIDFANIVSGATTYLALLRNHHYKVNITEVGARGLGNHEDAFNSAPANIKASIVEWSDGKFSEFAVNDQYLLGVSQGEFNFSREERTASSSDNILSIMTDYRQGWKIDKITDDAGDAVSWLRCSTTSGTGNPPAGDDLKLLLEANDTGQKRTAYIHVTADAGRLVYKVKVNQDVFTDVGIRITDTSNKEVSILEFSAAVDAIPVSQQIKLGWTPMVSDVFVNVSTIKNGGFTFAEGSDVLANGSVTDPTGSKAYTLQPPAITTANLTTDPFYERISVVLYSVSDAITTSNKVLTLRQFAYNMVPVTDGVYLMDGTKKSFGVRSNAPFEVEIKSNPNNVITLRTVAGVPNTSASGTPVYFDIVDDLSNPTLYQKDIVVTIKSPQGHFPDKDITLSCASGNIQDESNSYIVAPSGIGILIPVVRANKSELGVQLAASDNFSAELVWTDNSNGVANNSNIKIIKAIRSTTNVNDSYVLVMPGIEPGNAVVAIKDASDKILWSWHIWVTDYDPTTQWMDRNLGAIGNTAGQPNTKGLLYQWGRKDPFTGSTTIDGTEEPTIYDASGSTTTIAKVEVVEANNLGNAVANPKTFYFKTTTSSSDNNALWGSDMAKTVYDPCPKGYRVPSFDDSTWTWDALNTGNFTWNGTTMGRTNASIGGFYPAAGYRGSNGSFYNVGTNGVYWSQEVGYLSFNVTSSTKALYATDYMLGLSVRCVQE